MIGYITRTISDCEEATRLLADWKRRSNFLVGYIQPSRPDLPSETKLVAVFSTTSAGLRLAKAAPPALADPEPEEATKPRAARKRKCFSGAGGRL